MVGNEVHYRRKADVEQGTLGVVAFVDKGKSIDIYDWRNRDTTLAALQLSAQKWGSFSVYGNDDYKALCAKLAAEHGFNIANPELQDSIKRERERLQKERAEAMKSEPLKQFEQYAQAVGAERFRVTSIKLRGDGSEQTFILDKKDGVALGFTPQEIEKKTPEMQRLQSKGENLYYTPLSDNKHHILIDDMTQGKLERLIKDGYQPAVVMETSPRNYQALITVQKLGTPHDNAVGKRLAEQLNREYGNSKLSGYIHPHRAPGYENRQPHLQREDGNFPAVRLLKAEHLECVKTLALSNQINEESQRQAGQKAKRTDSIDKPTANTEVAPEGGLNAYRQHYNDELKRQRGAVDLSRIDSMIAVRLRVTGHSQADIESALQQSAPGIRRQKENRDWKDYAQRTARYAFSAVGDRQAAELEKYRQQWERLEGREPAQQPKQQHKQSNVERDQGMSR